MLLKDIMNAKALEKKEKKKNKLVIPPQIGEVNWRHIYKINKSVLPKIYAPVILVTIWTVLLKLFYDYYKEREFIKTVFFPTSLLTYLGLVLSLLLVFRNNSAYDRFWEGRKSWASILNHARNLSRHIWICVDIDENDKNKDQKLNLKKGVMRLIIALVISIRHSLRGEYGWDYDDLSELVKHVPRFNSLFTTAPTEVLKVLPLEIAYHIEGFLYSQKGIPVPMLNQSYASLNAIVENFTTCERILNSPIPVIYGIHIKHALLIYLLTLPLQIIPTCSWASVFIVFLTSFTLFGIEAISSVIENPFGKDKNDLRLDDFCQQVHDEINGMMKYFPSSVGFVDWFECEEIEDANITDSSSSVTVDINDDSDRSVTNGTKRRGSSTVRAISNITNKLRGRGKGKGKGKGRKDSIISTTSSECTCINGSTSDIRNYGSINSGSEISINVDSINPINDVATPEKKDAAAPEKKDAAPPEKKDAAPPEKKDAAPPEKKEAAAPEKKEAAPPEKKDAAAPEKKEAAPPEKKEAAPPEKKDAAPPEKKDAAPPEKKEAAPPEKKEAAPPEKKDAAPPEKKDDNAGKGDAATSK
eukprot:jgi/Orpsp1_1/1178912/evm.model.c7180000067202.1